MKKNLRMFALILSVLMVFTTLIVPVSADDSLPPKVYYFTDETNDLHFTNNCLAIELVTDNFQIYRETNQQQFWGTIMNGDTPLQPIVITPNTKIIFEASQGIPADAFGDNDEEPINFLIDYFESLQSPNCQIMFICDTDESRFAGDIVFPRSLVKLHVNTDLRTVFAANVIDEIEDIHNGDLNNCVFLIDRNSCAELFMVGRQNMEPNACPNFYFYDYLITHLKKIASDESYSSFETMLNEKNITILCQYDVSSFIKLTDPNKSMAYSIEVNPVRNINDVYSDIEAAMSISQTLVATVSNTKPDVNKGILDFNAFKAMQESLELSDDQFFSFLYDETNYQFPNTDALNGVKTLGRGLPAFPLFLCDTLMYDFMIEADLSGYHNWNALRIPITHKATIAYSPAGWIDSSFFFAAWLVEPTT